jgi:hypothetical protein
MPAIGELGGSIRRHPVRAAGVAAILLVLVAIAVGGDGGGDAGAENGSESGNPVNALRAAVPLPSLESAEAPEEVPGPRYAIARVRGGEEVELRDAPRGRVIEVLGDETEFGSHRTFWVARVQGGWLGVPAAELPNGRLGWIRADDRELEMQETRYSVLADVSDRSLEIRYGKEILDTFPVTVGAPGSPTPPGAYSITDGLAGQLVGRYYGCCILALTGHQPNLPADWLGGDRIAIHGTPGEIGVAASAGCLRASDVDMVSLFARLPLGAPVFIRG